MPTGSTKGHVAYRTDRPMLVLRSRADCRLLPGDAVAVWIAAVLQQDVNDMPVSSDGRFVQRRAVIRPRVHIGDGILLQKLAAYQKMAMVRGY